MRKRHLLIVHTSRAASNMVESYLLSDLSDLSFTEATSGKEALTKLQERQFDLVISEADLLDMGVIVLRNKMQGLELNKNTAFLLLAPVDIITPNYIEALNKAGIRHYLGVPFPSTTIIDKVNKICDPRSWRVNERFHIPNAKAVLHIGPLEVDIKLINISMGGILCEFSYNNQPVDFLGKNKISFYVPEPRGHLEIKDVSCKLSRMNVAGWNNEGMAQDLVLTWLFTDLSKENKILIEQTLEIAKETDLTDQRENA